MVDSVRYAAVSDRAKEGIMNTDIRVKVTFPNHHKTRKLRRKIGAEGVCALMFLWLFAAENRPDGVLSGMDEDDIAIAAQWDGDARRMLDAMLEVGFLELQAETYVIHDWVENNPWAADAPKRKAKAVAAAQAKWAKRNSIKDATSIESDASSIATSIENDATSTNEQCPSSNAPSPSPSPSPKEDKTFSSSADEEQADVWLSKKKRKLTGKRLETFKRFWDAFDYKAGRAEAIDAWLDIPQLTTALVDSIVSAAEREAKGRPEMLQQGRTPKMAQGWLTARRWEDERGNVVSIAAKRQGESVGEISPVTDGEAEKIRKVLERYER